MIDWRALVERQASTFINDDDKVRLRKVLDHYPDHFEPTVAIKYHDGYLPPDCDGEGESQVEPIMRVVVSAISDLYGGAPIEEFFPAQVPILAEALEAAGEFKIAQDAYSDSIAHEFIRLAERIAAVAARRKAMMPLFEELRCVVQGRVTGNVEAIGRAWNLNIFAERAIAAGFPMDVYHVRDVKPEVYETLKSVKAI